MLDVDPGAIERLFEAASLGAPENAVGFVLWRVMHAYQRAVDRRLAPLDLTHLQFTVLTMVAWLCRSGDAPTQAELARAAVIHPMQASLMLKALEGKRMVARTRSAVDPRTKLIGLTPAGLEVLTRALPPVVDLQRRIFGRAGEPGGALLRRLLEIDAAG